MTSSGSGQSARLLIIGVFLLAAAGVAGFAILRGRGGGESGGGATAQGEDQPSSGKRVTIDLLYSTEKKAWLEESVLAFEKAHPEIDVNLIGKGSLDAVREILDGKVKPTVWSPADDVALRLLANDWYQKQRQHLFAESGEGAPQPLVLTPVVFVAWQERGDVLTQKDTQPLHWKRLHTVLSSDQGWSAIGGSKEWGLIRVGHTDPTRSNSGLQALLLMAYEHHGKTSNLEVADILDQGFQTFVKAIEDGVPKFGDSTGTFMEEMILFGPSKYDVVVSYENLAIEQIPNAQGRWGNLRIYYPQHTLWSSHPAALLEAPWVTPEQKEAGRTLIGFLRAPEAQRGALRYGFRPADPSVPILSEQADNPFTAARAYGVRTDLPGAVEPPPGPVISNLMEMWSRQIGRR